jgi:stage II sporulation protein D
MMRVLLTSVPTEQPTRLDPWHFSWRQRTYRGDFAFVSLGDGRSGLVNTVPIDAYLYGVVSQEISELWPQAAQQAQTIVARTYALTRLRSDRPYDVIAGESNQSYGGIASETVIARAAVDATSGTILFFAGVPADVAYSASCGGHTEDAAEVWGKTITYLRGVADPNCTGMPGYVWQQSIPLAMLRALPPVRAMGMGRIRNLELRDTDNSGRPRRIAIMGDHDAVEMKSNAFRAVLGTAFVRSTLIRTATIHADVLSLEGNGFGHGVGLCQWGMYALAQRGASVADILQFYFRGTELGIW